MTDHRTFNSITKEHIGRVYEFLAKVIVVKQTSGPTLMVMEDGTASFTIKAFVKPGVRAYPEIDVGSYVRVQATITQREGRVEAEAKFMKLLNDIEKEEFEKRLTEIQNKLFEPQTTQFTIQSKVLDALKPRFIEVAKRIRKAVYNRRPILLRHNADCDGYSSAITIERAILGLIREITDKDKLIEYQNYRRAPSKAPFYEYEDCIKDLTFLLKDKARFGQDPPLIIITDNGSTEEDLLSIKQMTMYGCEVVVVDHHYPGDVKDGKVTVDEYVKAHINPYLEGYDSNVCAGMLGYELANFIFKENKNSVFIPAMAAILDHCDCEEKESYIELAKKEGYTYEYLETLGEIIDMQSFYLRFMEGREFISDLFGDDMKIQKNIVELFGEELKRRYKELGEVAKHYIEKKDFGPFYLIQFDGEKGTFRGEYPAIGKSTNYIHKTFEAELDKPVITMTYGPTFITVRVTDEIKEISMPEFAKLCIKKIPYTRADGGGHEHAGSVKFVEYGKEEVLRLFDEYLSDVAKKQ